MSVYSLCLLSSLEIIKREIRKTVYLLPYFLIIFGRIQTRSTCLQHRSIVLIVFLQSATTSDVVFRGPDDLGYHCNHSPYNFILENRSIPSKRDSLAKFGRVNFCPEYRSVYTSVCSYQIANLKCTPFLIQLLALCGSLSWLRFIPSPLLICDALPVCL